MPEFPQLPTDSLYKFLAIGGIALMIFAGWLFAFGVERLRSRLWALQRRHARNEVELTYLEREIASREEAGDDARSDPAVIARVKRARLRHDVFTVDVDEIRERRLEAKLMWQLSRAFLIVGVAAAVVGFSLWYVRVQAPQDAILAAQLDGMRRPTPAR